MSRQAWGLVVLMLLIPSYDHALDIVVPATDASTVTAAADVAAADDTAAAAHVATATGVAGIIINMPAMSC